MSPFILNPDMDPEIAVPHLFSLAIFLFFTLVVQFNIKIFLNEKVTSLRNALFIFSHVTISLNCVVLVPQES